MKLSKLLRRFLVPGPIRSLIYFMKFRAFVSPRAIVDLTPNLRLGRGVTIAAFTQIKATDGPLVVGDRSMIGPGCFISAGTKGITIGADSMIAANTVIVANNHVYRELDRPINQQGLTSVGIDIGRDVWIGANCSVLDGSSIGDSSIVNAGSVVSGSIDPRVVASGSPARSIFRRRA